MNGDRIIIVGCGGISGWLIQCLDKSKAMLGGKEIVLYDRDRIEEKNLDRQFFSKRDIGKSKAKAFYDKYKDSLNISFHPDWFTERTDVRDNDIIFVACDNNGGRLSALNICDMRENVTVIIGANDTITASAYVYKKEWKDSSFDARVRFPELLEHDVHDPTKPQCTGHVLEYIPQLAISNMLASSYMMLLYYLWIIKVPTYDSDYRIIDNQTKFIDSTHAKIMCNNWKPETVFA